MTKRNSNLNTINASLTRVAIYIRVSTDRQAKDGDSLDAQLKALKEYAKQNNYIVVDIYVDGGESGQKLKRTNLQRMLSDIEAGKIDLVIMTKLDRWFRNIADFYKVIEILKRNNVNWKTIWEDYDTTTASGEFWLNMSLAMGQMEAQRTGERINEVFEYKYSKKEVCSGSHIFGYNISTEKRLVVNEDEARILNLLYDKYIETNSINETTRWFNITNNSQVCARTIKRYLTNTAYIGRYRHVFKKTNEIEYIDGFSPQIIDNDKFNKVQDMLRINQKKCTRSNGNKRDYIFSGLVYCDECNSRMSGKNSRNKHYYVCRKKNMRLCNNNTNFSEYKLEQYLIDNVENSIRSEYEHYQAKQFNENKTNDNDIKTLERLKKKKEKLVELYTNDLIDITQYKEQYYSITNEIEVLSSKVEKEEKKDFTKLIDFCNSDWKTIYDTFTEKEKRELWCTIIDKVIVRSKDDFEFLLKLY